MASDPRQAPPPPSPPLPPLAPSPPRRPAPPPDFLPPGRAADEPLVGDALGQPQALLQRAERRLVLSDAGARDTFAPETSDQRNEQPVVAADLDSLAGDGQRVPESPLPDRRQGADKGHLPLKTEVANPAADGECPLDLRHRLLRAPLDLEHE